MIVRARPVHEDITLPICCSITPPVLTQPCCNNPVYFQMYSHSCPQFSSSQNLLSALVLLVVTRDKLIKPSPEKQQHQITDVADVGKITTKTRKCSCTMANSLLYGTRMDTPGQPTVTSQEHKVCARPCDRKQLHESKTNHNLQWCVFSRL